ncbi:MAG: AmmeMemoRadiSam system protein B [Spirochaetes bacterium]|nr:MAG: AmmeMemoRadiSam system protein B [Spirochaetota bacterium]
MNTSGFGKTQMRPPIVDGIFYPSSKIKLKKQVEQFINSVERPEDNALAVITPHAAFQYTGRLIAEAFKAAALREIKTVVIIGPMHRDPIDRFALPTARFFLTPMGKIRVNNKYIDALSKADKSFVFNNIPHFEEHSIEIQLPFIQFLFPKADIVPILTGKTTENNIKRLSRSLHLTFGTDYKYILFVATLNTSSYIYGTDPEAEASQFERLLITRNWHEIINAAEHKGLSACNLTGISSILAFADSINEGKYKIEILDTATTGITTRSMQKRVFYTSAALCLEEKNEEVR